MSVEGDSKKKTKIGLKKKIRKFTKVNIKD